MMCSTYFKRGLLFVSCFLLLVAVSSGEYSLLSLTTTLSRSLDRSTHVSVNHTFCAIFNPKYAAPSINKDHPHINDFHPVVYPSKTPESRVGCSSPIESDVPLRGRALILDRGNCSFYRKALTAQIADAAMLVVLYDVNQLPHFPHLYPPEKKLTNQDITIPVLYLLKDHGQQLKEWLSNSTEVHVNAHVKSGHRYNLTPFFMFCIAMGTVLISAFLANTPIKFLRYGLLLRPDTDPSLIVYETRETSSSRLDLMQGFHMVLYSCITIFLLYFFYKYVVYLILAFFSVLSIMALYHVLSSFMGLIALGKYSCKLPPNQYPILKYRPNIVFFITVAISVGVVLFWLIYRHSSYAWFLQDMLGGAFICMLLYYMVDTEVCVASSTLGIIFFYDIFMVFITPYFTKDGVSVMEAVATGKGSGSEEKLPLVFILPSIQYPSSPLDHMCGEKLRTNVPDMLLGFGDVYLPGMLISICLRYDLERYPKKWFKLYFFTSSIAYAVGLVLTGIALYVMRSAQPALLYLVPTTVGSVLVLSLLRREFWLFFYGKERNKDGGDTQVDSKPCRQRWYYQNHKRGGHPRKGGHQRKGGLRRNRGHG